MVMVHHLVLELFVGPRPIGKFALHRDDDRSNNHVTNLYWGTAQENHRDRRRNGREADKRGERHPSARLTNEIVLEIRRLYIEGVAIAILADRFNISFGHCCGIIKRKYWSHI
jgi:hypothetical protein